MNQNMVPMGRIVSVFGLKGWVKIRPSTQEEETIATVKQLYVLENDTWTLRTIEEYFIRGGILHAKFSHVSDRDAALQLKGALVGTPRDQLPKTELDEYYWVDLIGLSVYNTQKEYLGEVVNLMETGSTSVLVIKDTEQQRLVPFVAVYIIDVDLTKRQIIADWGLDY